VAEPGLRAEVKARLALNDEEVDEWAVHGVCGIPSERLLGYLNDPESLPRTFAVGFVSAFAGFLLAAETLKDILGAPVPLNDRTPRTVFTFHRAADHANGAGAYLRDPQCPACAPGEIRTRIWAERFAQAPPTRP
jgi:hypothetical protein